MSAASQGVRPRSQRMRRKVVWTNERIERLQDLWLAGRSAAEISEELGNGISRNAVIGKVSRLGLTDQSRAPSVRASHRSSNIASTPRYRRPAWEATATAPRRQTFARLVLPRCEEKHDYDQTILSPLARCVTLDELEAEMCRWPLGDPISHEFRFCGAQSISKRSYCACHLRAAYRPEPRPRRENYKRARMIGRRLEFN
jgi:GcrA cell cycle regulator